jgi:hypothetical protein
MLGFIIFLTSPISPTQMSKCQNVKQTHNFFVKAKWVLYKRIGGISRYKHSPTLTAIYQSRSLYCIVLIKQLYQKLYPNMGLCRICGKNYGAFGNNGVPLINGMVCDSCNGEVVGFRMKICKIDNQDLVDALAEAQVAKIQLGIEKKKNEVAKSCIKTLGDTAKKYKAELDEIAQEECVMPMIDRIMTDANNDIKALQDKLDESNRLVAENAGYRCCHHRHLCLAAEGLFMENLMEDMEEWTGDAETHRLMRIGIPQPDPLNAEGKRLLKVSDEDLEAHYRCERQGVADMVVKYARRWLDEEYGEAAQQWEITDPTPCPHCDDCKNFHTYHKD